MRVDGTVLTPGELAGYELLQTKPAVKETKLVTGLTTTYAVTDPGQYCFKARAVDKQKLKSAWSNEACATVAAAVPAKITIKVTTK